MILFLFVGLFPLASSLKGKNELKQCYEGIFMRNATRLKNTQIIKTGGRGCVMSLTWEQTARTVNTGNPKKPHRTRMECKANTLWAEVRAANHDTELTKKFHDAPETKPEKLVVDEIYYGDEIELEEDRTRRLEAEAAGNVSRRTTVTTTTEKPPIERYCLLFSKENTGNMTCWCFTDYCNSIESNFVMDWFKDECARARRVGETEKQYKTLCGDDELDAVSCLQPAMEKGLQVANETNIRRVHIGVNRNPNYGHATNPGADTIDYSGYYEQDTVTSSEQSGDETKETKTALIVGICVGVGVFLLLAITAGTIFFFVMRRRRRQREELFEVSEEVSSVEEASTSTAVSKKIESTGPTTTITTVVKEETTGGETKIKSEEPSTEGLKDIFEKMKPRKRLSENRGLASFDQGDHCQEVAAKTGQEKSKDQQKPEKKRQVKKKSAQNRKNKKTNGGKVGAKKTKKGAAKEKKTKSKPSKTKKKPAAKKSKRKK